jgi:hypothetical protein
MAALCILAAGKTATLAAATFTLAWTHSVERTRWEEDWRLAPAGLEIVEARVKGSGAGMDPPEGAVLRDGWWAYAPKLPVQQKIVLGSSGATVSGWSLCGEGRCLVLGAAEGDPVTLYRCRENPPQ